MNRAVVWAVFLLFFLVSPLNAQKLFPPDHQIVDGNFLVSVRLDGLPERILEEIRNGIEKRVEYHIELVREWDGWMDEFVDEVTIVRTIKYDVTKKQYELTSLEGRYLYEKSMRDPDRAMEWLTGLSGVHLVRPENFPRGTYYVRVRAEFRRIQLPALLKVVLFFVPEIEFRSEVRGMSFPLNK